MPGAILDFPSLSFQVPICGFAAKHATVAANDSAVTTAVIRVFICGGDFGRNAFGRQHQFQTIRCTTMSPFQGLFQKILAEPYVGDDLQLVVASRDASEKRYWRRLRGGRKAASSRYLSLRISLRNAS
jgi:hypothetical protein